MDTIERNDPTKLSGRDKKIRPRARNVELRFKFWQLLATYVSLGVAIFGILYVVRSLDNNTKSVRNSVQQNMLSLVTGLDRVFVDNPELHPYFYECLEIKEDPNDRRYQQVFATAVQTLDVLDIAESQINRFSEDWDTPQAWENWINDSFTHSPVLRQVLHKHISWYGKGLKDSIVKVEQKLKDMEKENKRPCD
jgi:hypothetical protein